MSVNIIYHKHKIRLIMSTRTKMEKRDSEEEEGRQEGRSLKK